MILLEPQNCGCMNEMRRELVYWGNNIRFKRKKAKGLLEIESMAIAKGTMKYEMP